MADLRTTLTIVGRNQTRRAIREVRGDLSGLSQQFRDLRRDALALAGVTISVGSVAQLASLADNYQLISARLRVATGDSADFVGLQEEIFAVAQRTNTSLESTSDLYARVARSTRDLGISQQSTLALTQAVNQSLRLSGAGTSEASALVTQFGQALASGVLRGDEFNSVMENGSRLALALADGLGVGIGQLRAMAEQGELTADVVINALLSQQQVIADEAANLPLTIGAAYTNLTNALTRYIGQANEANGVTGTVAEGIGALAENFAEVADAAVVVGGLLLAAYGGRALGALTAYSVAQAKAAIDTRRLAVITLEGLRAKEADALAARAAAVANLNMARTMDQATGGMARQAIAAREVAKAHTAYTAAATASANAAKGLSVAAAAGRGALALLGGPVGAITTALLVGVTAWSAYGDEAQAAAADLESFSDTADRLLGDLDAISRRQIQSTIDLGESEIAAIEQRIKVASAALRSSQDEQHTIELRRELAELQEQEIEKGDKLLALRQKLASIGTDAKTSGGGGAAGSLDDENKKIKELISERDKLVADLKRINDKLTAGPEPKEQTSSFNIGRLNTLRNTASGKFDRGDQEGAIKDLQQARGIIEALADSGEVSAGYLQTQIRLVTELAGKAKQTTPEIDTEAAEKEVQDYASIRDEFLRQNPGKTQVHVAEEESLAKLSAFIKRMEEEASKNAITVPIQPGAAAEDGLPAKAGGGPITGPGPVGRDSVLMWGAPGEHMLTAAEVRAAGGHGAVYRLRKALRNGWVPRYATGGPIAPRVPRLPTLSQDLSLNPSIGPIGPVRVPATVDLDINANMIASDFRRVLDSEIRNWFRRETDRRGSK